MMEPHSDCCWCWGAGADPAESYFELGMAAYFDSTDRESSSAAAESHFEHAGSLGHQPALLALGDLFIRQGRLHEAEASFDRALKVHYNRVSESYYSLGLAHREKSNRSEGQRLFRKALAVDPAHSDAKYLLACSSLDGSVPHADHAYVTHLFDQYSNDFDAHLLNELEVSGRA